MKRLLVVSCSARKHPTTGEGMGALWLYRGAPYQMMQQLAFSGNWPSDLEVRVLSAMYGLVWLHTRMQRYDCRMDDYRRHLVGGRAREELRDMLRTRQYGQVYLHMGKEYLAALQPLTEWAVDGIPVYRAEGGIGKQFAALKKWVCHGEIP